MSSVADLLSELNDHGFTDTGTTRKVAVINDTIWEVCSREPWPFLEKSLDLNFDGSDASPSNFPSDFRALLSIAHKDDGDSLTYLRLDEVDKQYGEDADENGEPEAFYLQAGELRVVPVPEAATAKLRMRYLHWPTAVTDATAEAGIIIPARHHRVIVLGALWKLYDMEDDPELAQRFLQHFEARLLQMKDELWKQQYDQTEFITITDSFDGDYGC